MIIGVHRSCVVANIKSHTLYFLVAFIASE